MEQAFFIDRDGVVNKMVLNSTSGEYDSPQTIDDVYLNEEIVEVISWANKRGLPVVEVSNQPGVAKGKMNIETLEAIESKIHDLLSIRHVKVDIIYRCFHHPRGVVPELTVDCECRKPKPGLLLHAAVDLGIDLTRSILLGDNATDVEAGKRAGCKTIIFLHGKDAPEKVVLAEKAEADFKVYSLSEVLPIESQFFGAS